MTFRNGQKDLRIDKKVPEKVSKTPKSVKIHLSMDFLNPLKYVFHAEIDTKLMFFESK